MPHSINTKTTPLAKVSLLLYYPQAMKLLYGRTVFLAANTIVSTPRITAS